ncbi:CHAP domain-containing protein [Actinosynnema sp. NPDC059335]|uniref:CHAP domain-containing protein n=1 Tax=Actinosynnema sp. NPDC059335 TaxID=3346804 RepID=UPI00366C11CE
MTRRATRAVLGAALAASLLLGGSPALAQAEPLGDQAQWRIRQEIVDQALRQVGQREGNGNYYPPQYQVEGQGVLRPAEWCGVFVNWAWTTAGVPDRPSMRPAPGAPVLDQGHWATYWQKWGKANGRWKDIAERDVAPGDAVVYGNYPDMHAHVGLVVEVRYDRTGRKATHVRTVEGNFDDRVVYSKLRKIEGLNAGKYLQATGFVSPF